MKHHTRYRRFLGVSALFIALILNACASRSTPETVRASATPAPRMTIVTSSTRVPTNTPGAFPSVTPAYLCDNAPRNYIIVRERGRVTYSEDGETLNMRTGPGTNYDIMEQIEQLENFYVLDGPVCSALYTWYKVEYQGRIGWIAEGDDEQYFAEPYLVG